MGPRLPCVLLGFSHRFTGQSSMRDASEAACRAGAMVLMALRREKGRLLLVLRVCRSS